MLDIVATMVNDTSTRCITAARSLILGLSRVDCVGTRPPLARLGQRVPPSRRVARRHSRVEADGLTALVTRVPRSLRMSLRIYCAEREIEMQRVVEGAVRERLDAERRRRR
jgi:hypothetical protein